MTAMEIFTGTEDTTIERREGRKALIRSALIILAIAILATLPGWMPGRIYGAADGESAASRLAVEYAAQRLKTGEIPLWNPNVGLGVAVIGDGQTGVFFPTILLHMVMPATWSWTMSAVVRLWLAGFGGVVLARRVQGSGFRVQGEHGHASTPAHATQNELSILPAVFAGVVFMLGGLCIGFRNVSAMNAISLLPWAMLASEGLFRRLSAARLVGMTLLFLVIFLAGSNAASAGVMLACVIYLVWNFARQPRQWSSFVGALFALVAAAGVAGLVGAVQWMPAYSNAQFNGINGFAFRHGDGSVVGGFLVLQLAILGSGIVFGRAMRGWKEHGWRRVVAVVVLGISIGLLVLGMLCNSGAHLPPRELSEASGWLQRQGESSQTEGVRFIAEGSEAWEIPGNMLAPAVSLPERTRQWLRSVEQLEEGETRLPLVDHPALRLPGLKYLITSRPLEPATRPATSPSPDRARRLFGGGPAAVPMGKMDWKPVWPTTRPSRGVVVYENVAQPLPRFWIARNALWSVTAGEVMDRLKKSAEQADFDPHDVVLLDREVEGEAGEFGLLRRPPPGTGTGTLQLLEDSPERVRIATEGAGGWLVLADAYAPGWRAKMSYVVVRRTSRRAPPRESNYERELAIVPAYGAMRAVALQGGAEVVFEYEPKGWKNGLMVAAIGGIVLLILVGGMMFPSEKDTGETPVLQN
ncbi:MAG TPA: hypothetical protein VGQ99_10710 [Tepidisphaeraceae bacterium]|nr:hypothetical protein [Tepidisphaeraceae bacterium]